MEAYPEYRLMGDPELNDEREKLSGLLSTVDDSISFSKTSVGKRTIYRLDNDLKAVMNRYHIIKGGTDSEIVRELCTNQGRENQIREELSMLRGANSFKNDLTKRSECVMLLLKTKKQDSFNSR